VHLNQFGFLTEGRKWAAVPVSGDGFEVRRHASHEVVFSGPLQLRRAADPASGQDVWEADFSALTEGGWYYLRVPRVGDSPPFLISDDIYDRLFRIAVQGLYYQRCGTAIGPIYGGQWQHDECHAAGPSAASYHWSTTSSNPAGFVDTRGGWHDAGNYGKYSTNNGYAVGILLQAYEQYPSLYRHDDCGIPESGNGIPDILDEARWSLEWMLRMQGIDGSVRHRESVAGYTGEAVPHLDEEHRYHTAISSDATAIHCAAMALAARVYRVQDRDFAAACSTSAASAWGWLLTHEDRVPVGGFANRFGHEGAEYILGSETERRFWAAAEIFRLTRWSAAREAVDEWWTSGGVDRVIYPDSWAAVANLGAFSYHDAPGADPDVVGGSWGGIEQTTRFNAEVWTNRSLQDGYGCVAKASPGYGDYYWGFTGVVLRYAWAQIQAWRYTGNESHREAASDQLHYILGRNPMGKCYMTGVGTRPVLHAHGAWNFAAGYVAVDDEDCAPVPGQLVGGPNQADNWHISSYPGRCYQDIADPAYANRGNYTLNEPAVNLQTALIALVGFLSSGNQAPGLLPPSEEEEVDRRWREEPVRVTRAFPNPGRGAITVQYLLPSPSPTRLSVHDVHGREVKTLVHSVQDPGPHNAVWSVPSIASGGPPPGVYYLRLSSDGQVSGARVVLTGP
jgi:endoglucanase